MASCMHMLIRLRDMLIMRTGSVSLNMFAHLTVGLPVHRFPPLPLSRSPPLPHLPCRPVALGKCPTYCRDGVPLLAGFVVHDFSHYALPSFGGKPAVPAGTGGAGGSDDRPYVHSMYSKRRDWSVCERNTRGVQEGYKREETARDTIRGTY